MSDRELLNLGKAVVTQTVMERPKWKQDVFPLTGLWVQRMSRRLGRPVGEHRALEIIRLLLENGVVLSSGSYRQNYNPCVPSGFRVRLFRLPRIPQRLRQEVSVRRASRDKFWWEHSAFGFGLEEYPSYLPRRLARWKEPPEWKLPWLTAGQR